MGPGCGHLLLGEACGPVVGAGPAGPQLTAGPGPMDRAPGPAVPTTGIIFASKLLGHRMGRAGAQGLREHLGPALDEYLSRSRARWLICHGITAFRETRAAPVGHPDPCCPAQLGPPRAPVFRPPASLRECRACFLGEGRAWRRRPCPVRAPVEFPATASGELCAGRGRSRAPRIFLVICMIVGRWGPGQPRGALIPGAVGGALLPAPAPAPARAREASRGFGSRNSPVACSLGHARAPLARGMGG